MIVVTGAAGFIGSCLVGRLNREGFHNIVAVDDFTRDEKTPNLAGKTVSKKIDRSQFFSWTENNDADIDLIYHFGARTNTLEMSASIFDELNLSYSKSIWKLCATRGIPLVYASSAATYGDGRHGYGDDRETTRVLEPLNPYASSKQSFDLWVLEQGLSPPAWAGLKFFNVFGPNEYHKGKMSSMVFQAYQQIKRSGSVRLFKSYLEDYPDGGQKRDFIYVMHILDLCMELMQNSLNSLINVGTGKAETFNQMVRSIFTALDQPVQIEYIDMPTAIRDKYQYHTTADLSSYANSHIQRPSGDLGEDIAHYVRHFLRPGKYY